MNQFNYLLGDNFTVDDSMNISPVAVNGPDFREFYKVLHDNLWQNGFYGNTDTMDCIKNNVDNVKVLSITMNSAGLIYPLHLNGAIKNSTFNNSKFLSKIEKEKKGFSKKVFDDIIKHSFPNTDNDSIFYKLKWFNDITVSEYSKAISKLVDSCSVNKIYFFIHGYNVPVGLAHIQGNRFIKMIHDNHLEEGDTALFIRVFWDAEKLKAFKTKTRKIKKNPPVYKLKKIVYRDKIRLRNALRWTPVLHRSQHCGLSLRSLLVELSKEEFGLNNKTFMLITHSQGGFLAVNAITKDIRNIVYLKQDKEDSLYHFFKKHDFNINYLGTDSEREYFKRKFTKPWYVFERMADIDSIKLNLNLFANAPAMAGSAFNSLKHTNDTNYNYTIIAGYNYFDPTLSKRFIFKGKAISRKRSKKFRSTSLGIDFDNDVIKTSRGFENIPSVTFFGANTSNYFQHDIFYYTRHPLFKMEFNKMKYLK